MIQYTLTGHREMCESIMDEDDFSCTQKIPTEQYIMCIECPSLIVDVRKGLFSTPSLEIK